MRFKISSVGGRSWKSTRFAALCAVFVFGAQFSFAQIASDNAGNYSSGWSNGDNQGSGFGPWEFENNNNNTNRFAGAYLATSNNPSGRNSVIFSPDASGKAFILYAHPTGAYMNAKRNFGGSNAVPLAVGESFNFSWVQYWGDGDKGINLYRSGWDDGNDRTMSLRQNGDGFVAQPRGFTNSPVAISNAFNNVTTIKLRRAAPDTLVLTVQTDEAADGSYTNTFRSPAPDRVKFYYANGPAGGDENNPRPLFNNLSITADSVPVATRPVKFSVNMGVLEGQTPKKFDPASGDKVFVRGYPSGGWGDGEKVELIQEAGKTVYSATLVVKGDTGLKSGGYKFFIEKGASSVTVVENGGYESSTDREFDLPGGGTNLPGVYFNNVLPSRNVTFAVDMGAQVRAGTFVLGTDKVYLVGDPTDWGTGVEMIREGGAGSIYKLTIPLFGESGATRFYKFKSSNAAMGDNGYEPDANPDPTETARVLTLGTADTAQPLGTVWYNNVSAFTIWSGNAAATPELVGKYAIGGSSGPHAQGEAPTVGTGFLTPNHYSYLEAIVRTDDVKLTFSGESTSDLSAGFSSSGSWTIEGAPTVSQTGVQPGFERKRFIYWHGIVQNRTFLRLKATLQP